MSIEQLAEAYAVPGIGNPVDRTEFLYDDPSFGLGTWALGATTLSDRKDGKFFPVYQCETDLAMQRAQARALCGITRIHDGAMDALANYTFGQGFTFEVTCRAPGDHAPLMAFVQRIIDEFCDINGMAGDLDREIHSRSRQDGEAFVKLRCDREGKIRAQILEPDQITEPGDARAVEDYEGLCRSIEDSPLNWAFGIATEKEDSSCVVGYYVKTDDGGADWEYLPVGRMQHFKRNVTRNAKRGVTDFYGIFSDFLNEAKLRRNSTTGAAVQAAIAWIVQYAPGVTSSQATSVGMTNSVATVGQATQGGIVQKNALHNPPGTVLRTGAGQTFMPGPMGAERNAGFVEIAQYALRAIGQRWNAPEYLISGDASNANYASSLVAESPFVKARQADQHWYGQQFKSLLWKVIEFHHRAGRFERFGCSMESLRHWCDIVVNYPTVESRNMGETAQALKILVDDLGIMSKRTAATKVDLDLDEELKQGAEAKALPQPMGLGGGFGGMMGGPAGAPGGMPGGPGGMPGPGKPIDDQSPLEPTIESIEEAERWITIGGDEDGGGTHVKINGDGTITVGPSSIEGKKVGSLSSKKGNESGGAGNGGKAGGKQPQPPKRNPKLTIRQADAKLRKAGYQIEGGEEYDMENKQARYRVKQPDGKTKVMTSGDIFGLIAGVGEKIGNAVNSAVDRSINATRKVDPSDTASQPEEKKATKATKATDSPAFKSWFAGSKVVDSKGKPLVVYHGTNADFDAFDINKSAATDIKGVFFGTSEKLAGSFGSKNIIAAHVKIENPATFADVQRVAKSGVKIPQIHKALQKEGFDGIYDPGRGLVVAFDPKQIKSVDNAGTFDPKSDKFREATALESAITAALESVTTSAEARAILEQLTAAESTGCESLNV